jgi:monofunctional biosynthetic peptidoglycan transglycosylase
MTHNSEVKKTNRLVRWILFFLKIIAIAFIVYSALFSVTATGLIIYGTVKITAPIRAIKILRTHNPKETLYMKTVRQELEREGGTVAIKREFVPLDSISSTLIECVLAAEDDGFYQHPGFDINAIADAYNHNKSRNATKRGASTITQQLAKNLFTGGEKTYGRKYLELAYAVLEEKFLGKDRILELYLNYAQWGKNIFGCEAAARFFFNKSCKKLSFDEAARMAAILAKPSTLNPHSEKSMLLQKRILVIANNLFLNKKIDTDGYMRLTDTLPPSTADSTRPADSVAQSPDTTVTVHPARRSLFSFRNRSR